MATFPPSSTDFTGSHPSHYSINYVWDVNTLTWVREEQSGGSSGGGGPIQDGVDTAIKATVFDFTNSNPLATVLVDANGDPVFTGVGAVTIADGADVAEGATTDAAVITDTTGTVSGKIRGLVKWAFERMPVSLGQKAMAASLPVVIASDQSAVHTIVDSGAITVSATNLDIHDLAFATDKVDVSGSAVTATITGTVTANQGTPAITANRWPVQLTDGTDLALVTAAGEINVLATAQPGVDIGDVTINNAAGGAAVNVQDGGNSLTIDNSTLSVLGGGTEATALRVTIANDSTGLLSVDDNGGSLTVDGVFFQATQPISAVALPLPAGASTLAAQTQPGVDIGDVTINNAAGASAVNVQDGGNSITVDGTVSLGAGAAVIGHVITDSGSTTVVTGNVTVVQATGTNLHAVTDTGSVTNVDNAAGASAVNIQDGGNSITVDGAVTANAGTNLNTSLLALASTQTDGTQKSIVRGGAKGATTAADVTSTAQSVDRQGLDVQIRTSAGVVVDSFGGGFQYAEDTPHVTGDMVTLAGVVQQTADAALSSDGDRSLLQVDASGFLKVNVKTGGSSPTLPATSTTTRVIPAWRQDVVILAANASRKEGLIVNGTNAPFFLKEGSGASDASYMEVLPPRGRYIFDGTMAIDGWWNQLPTDGFVFATERT